MDQLKIDINDVCDMSDAIARIKAYLRPKPITVGELVSERGEAWKGCEAGILKAC